MSRCILVVLLVAALGSVPASAQEPARPFTIASADFWTLALPPVPLLPLAGVSESIAQAPPAPATSVVQLPNGIERPGTSLNAMCVSFAALQVLDLHATFRAIDNGAREANPFLGGIASNKGAMIGLKAATTAGTIYLVQKFGVKNRVASTILMAAANSAYAIIVAHNYRVGSVRR